MNRCLIIPCVLVLGILSVRATDEANSPAPAPVTDPAQIARHYQQVLTRPEYQETAEPDVTSHFEDSLTLWFKQLGIKFGEFKYANQLPAFELMLMTILVTLTVAGLLYIMLRLTRRRARMEAGLPTSVAGDKTFHPPEFYDEEIHHAIRTGDWHAAWLAAWRQFLSRLEHDQLVEADRTRTNREYLAQLRARPLPSSAVALLIGMVDAYDRFIYGRKSIAEPDWNQFHQQIEEAGLLLHLDDKTPPARAKPAGT